MVGEIRDKETAEIAVQASLTGHLVLSPVHTNDAPGAITRLVDMGVEPFLVASSLIGVLAQRLVRTICPKCSEDYEPTIEELRGIGIDASKARTLRKGRGCSQKRRQRHTQSKSPRKGNAHVARRRRRQGARGHHDL